MASDVPPELRLKRLLKSMLRNYRIDPDEMTRKEIQEFIEDDPGRAYLMLAIGRLLYNGLSRDHPKRFKVFAETLLNGLPARFKVQARLVHDNDWAAGIIDDLEGEGSLEHVAPTTMTSLLC